MRTGNVGSLHSHFRDDFPQAWESSGWQQEKAELLPQIAGLGEADIGITRLYKHFSYFFLFPGELQRPPPPCPPSAPIFLFPWYEKKERQTPCMIYSQFRKIYFWRHYLAGYKRKLRKNTPKRIAWRSDSHNYGRKRTAWYQRSLGGSLS